MFTPKEKSAMRRIVGFFIRTFDKVVGAMAIGNANIAVAAEAANAIAVSVQLVDFAGENVVGKRFVRYWLSDAPGAAQSATVPVTSVVVTGGVRVYEPVAKISGDVVTDANGAFTVTVTEPGNVSWYLNIGVDGRTFSSTVIDFN